MWLSSRHARQNQNSKKLIEGNDEWANLAYYCLHKLKILPSQLMAMDDNEKAFIAAAVQIKVKEDAKAAKKAKGKR